MLTTIKRYGMYLVTNIINPNTHIKVRTIGKWFKTKLEADNFIKEEKQKVKKLKEDL